MNKTVSINISGIVFNIDEEAFQLLNRYLNTIKGYFSDSEGRDEIMSDIEARIAEMLSEKLNDRKQVISKEDIEEVIAIMGEPEAYIDEEAQAEKQSANERQRSSTNNRRRLYRDTEGKTIGGVCSGIGYYFGFDPAWLRIAFLVTLFFGGLGLYLYLILWAVLPPASTRAEKLEMRGEPVNYENIGKAVEDEMENVKQKFNDFTQKTSTRETTDRVNQSVSKFFDALGIVIVNLTKIIGKVIGLLLLIVAVILVLSFVFALLQWNSPVFHFSNLGPSSASFNQLSEFIFTSPSQSIMALIGVGVLFLIPLLALIIYGSRIIFNFKRQIRGLGIILLVVWFAALVLCLSVGFQVGSEFQRTGDFDQSEELGLATTDTLHLDINKDPFRLSPRARRSAPQDVLLRYKNNALMLGHPQLMVRTSTNDKFEIEVYKTSQGPDADRANLSAEAIRYHYELDSNRAFFDTFYMLGQGDPFRKQRVKVYLSVPVGGSIYLGKRMDRIIYDIDNVTNTYDHNMVNHYWKMTSRGLECTDCEKTEQEEAATEFN